MRINKLKQLFSLSKAERIGFISILIMISLSIAIPKLDSKYQETQIKPISAEVITSYEKEIAEFESDTIVKEKKNIKKKQNIKRKKAKYAGEYKPEEVPQY